LVPLTMGLSVIRETLSPELTCLSLGPLTKSPSPALCMVHTDIYPAVGRLHKMPLWLKMCS